LNTTDNHGRTALTWAARHKHIAIVQAILPHLDAAALNTQDAWGTSALMMASLQGHTVIVVSLMSHLNTLALKSADKPRQIAFMKTALNLIDQHGFTAVMLAARYGFSDIVTAFLPYLDSADLSMKNLQGGDTALMLAASLGRTDIVSILSSALDPASLNLTNNNGRTALELASNNDRRDVVFLLLSKMTFRQLLTHQNGHNVRLSTFARVCEQEVHQLRSDILQNFLTFRRIPALNSGPGKLVLKSFIYPEWYRDRAGKDVEGIYKQLAEILKNEKKNHRAPITLRAPTSKKTIKASATSAQFNACSSVAVTNAAPSLEALKTSAPAVTFACVNRMLQRIRNYWSAQEMVTSAEQGAAKKAKIG
jgi:hypothetical protein